MLAIKWLKSKAPYLINKATIKAAHDRWLKNRMFRFTIKIIYIIFSSGIKMAPFFRGPLLNDQAFPSPFGQTCLWYLSYFFSFRIDSFWCDCPLLVWWRWPYPRRELAGLTWASIRQKKAKKNVSSRVSSGDDSCMFCLLLIKTKVKVVGFLRVLWFPSRGNVDRVVGE